MKKAASFKMILSAAVIVLVCILGTGIWKRVWYRDFFPQNSQEIKIWGGPRIGSTRLEWKYRIPEKEFLAWCTGRGYQLKDSQDSNPIEWYNDNPDSGSMFGAKNYLSFFRHLPEGYLPRNYYFYNHRNDDAEGITLLYDRSGEHLYGSFYDRY